MKQLIGISILSVLLTGTVIVRAEGGHCAGKGGGAGACNSEMFSKLNLTDDQKTKLSALRADIAKDAAPEKSREKFMAGVKQILTAEQMTQFQAECDKVAKGAGCPFSAKHDESAKTN